MKVLIIFDQIQAGLGGKENSKLPLGAKMMPMGSANMLEPALKEVDGRIISTLYCGDEFFEENKTDVAKKVIGMIKKVNPDVVICGPAYNYEGYAKMCAILTKAINKYTDIPAITAMSQENNKLIEEYKEVINIVKMPKKGGTGLNDSLRNICKLANKKAKKEDASEYIKEICY